MKKTLLIITICLSIFLCFSSCDKNEDKNIIIISQNEIKEDKNTFSDISKITQKYSKLLFNVNDNYKPKEIDSICINDTCDDYINTAQKKKIKSSYKKSDILQINYTAKDTADVIVAVYAHYSDASLNADDYIFVLNLQYVKINNNWLIENSKLNNVASSNTHEIVVDKTTNEIYFNLKE